MSELDAVLGAAGAVRTGPPGGLYDNELFTEERGAMVVYIPVADPPSRGAVTPLIIPATDLATTIHAGPHDDIDVTYAALGTYVSQQALEVPDRCERSTTSGPATPTTAPHGARRSAGPSSRLPPGELARHFPHRTGPVARAGDRTDQSGGSRALAP